MADDAADGDGGAQFHAKRGSKSGEKSKLDFLHMTVPQKIIFLHIFCIIRKKHFMK